MKYKETVGYVVLELDMNSGCLCEFCKINKLVYQQINRFVFGRHNVNTNTVDNHEYMKKNHCVKCGKSTYKKMYCGKCKKEIIVRGRI